MERLTYFDHGKWRIQINGVEYASFPFVERLAAYENTGLMPEEIDSIFINGVIEENRHLKDELNRFRNEPNYPLSLEELREMDGEPVWDNLLKTWGIVVGGCILYRNGEKACICGNGYYRRKPEEGTV